MIFDLEIGRTIFCARLIALRTYVLRQQLHFSWENMNQKQWYKQVRYQIPLSQALAALLDLLIGPYSMGIGH